MPFETEERIGQLTSNVAKRSIGPSTLRGITCEGGLQLIKSRLSEFDMQTLNAEGLARQLDHWTCELMRLEAWRAGLEFKRRWGPARKAVNLFLRDVAYNRYLGPCYVPEDIRALLELPLDSRTMGGLEGDELPANAPRIIDLSPELSACYQAAAQRLAQREGMTRVDLDVILWT